MKSILSEIVKIELLKSLISEGRIEDAKAKYPEDIEVVEHFISQDPSGNNKYLPWMMKTYKQISADVPEGVRTQAKELIPNLIKGFHQHSARLEKKDINQYKTLAELYNVINPVIKAAEEKSIKKEKEEKGVKKLYEDADWLFLQPLEYKSSCKYGANTKWCVASKDTEQHFKSYTKQGLLLFLIHKKTDNKFAFYVNFGDYGDYGEAFSNVEIYNPIDTDISDNNIGLVSDIEDFLNGLVTGELENYINQDEDDYGEEEFELYKIKADGTRKHLITEYDSHELHDIVIEELMGYLLPGKTTLVKGKKALNMIGYDITLGKAKKGHPIPWTIHELGNPKNDIGEYGDDLKDYINSLDLDTFIENTLISTDLEDIYTDIIKKNNLPYVIVGYGFDDSTAQSKKIDSTGVMSKKQAKAILSKYNEIKDKTSTEQLQKIDLYMKNLVAGIKIDEKYLKIASKCFEDSRGTYACMNDTAKINPFRIDIKWRNPNSGRMLTRHVRNMLDLFQAETGSNIAASSFIDRFFKELVKSN